MGRVAAVAVVMLTAIALPMSAQHDSAHAELRTVLRAFYFNLAHHDWEAIAADVRRRKYWRAVPLLRAWNAWRLRPAQPRALRLPRP